MKKSADAWAADTQVSRPDPIHHSRPALVDLGGFAMTSGGLTHNVTQGDIEDIFTPMFAPEGWRDEDG